MPVLTPQEVREFISDKADKNYLLDGEEVSNTMINLCMDLAVSEFNTTAPTSSYDVTGFPYKALLLSGTLWKIYSGLSALVARNNFSYSDGGVQVPLEERYQMYSLLASTYLADFNSSMSKIKIGQNMNDGWGGVSSDYSRMPIW
jgi:hypothetical protein